MLPVINDLKLVAVLVLGIFVKLGFADVAIEPPALIVVHRWCHSLRCVPSDFLSVFARPFVQVERKCAHFMKARLFSLCPFAVATCGVPVSFKALVKN